MTHQPKTRAIELAYAEQELRDALGYRKAKPSKRFLRSVLWYAKYRAELAKQGYLTRDGRLTPDIARFIYDWYGPDGYAARKQEKQEKRKPVRFRRRQEAEYYRLPRIVRTCWNGKLLSGYRPLKVRYFRRLRGAKLEQAIKAETERVLAAILAGSKVVRGRHGKVRKRVLRAAFQSEKQDIRSDYEGRRRKGDAPQARNRLPRRSPRCQYCDSGHGVGQDKQEPHDLICTMCLSEVREMVQLPKPRQTFLIDPACIASPMRSQDERRWLDPNRSVSAEGNGPGYAEGPFRQETHELLEMPFDEGGAFAPVNRGYAIHVSNEHPRKYPNYTRYEAWHFPIVNDPESRLSGPVAKAMSEWAAKERAKGK